MSAGVPAEVTAAGELWAGVLVQLSSVTSACLLFVVVVVCDQEDDGDDDTLTTDTLSPEANDSSRSSDSQVGAFQAFLLFFYRLFCFPAFPRMPLLSHHLCVCVCLCVHVCACRSRLSCRRCSSSERSCGAVTEPSHSSPSSWWVSRPLPA